MITIEERMAEIKRRSEVILKKRRQRKKIFWITSISTIICVSLYLQSTKYYKNSDMIQDNNIIATNSIEDTTESTMHEIHLMSVKVIGSGIEITNNQKEVLIDVAHIFDCITATESTDCKINDEFSTSSSEVSGNFNNETDYRFILTNIEGQSKEYVLKEHFLIDLNTNKKYPVDHTDVTLLLQILGINLK